MNGVSGPGSPFNPNHNRKMIPIEHGDNVLSAPITPGNRLPVVDKTKVDPKILKVAQGFESMFMELMLKEMRKTVPKNEFDLENRATEIYRSMMDEETVARTVKGGGVGLADQIIAYLQTEGYTNRQANPPKDLVDARSKPQQSSSKQGGLP